MSKSKKQRAKKAKLRKKIKHLKWLVAVHDRQQAYTLWELDECREKLAALGTKAKRPKRRIVKAKLLGELEHSSKRLH